MKVDDVKRLVIPCRFCRMSCMSAQTLRSRGRSQVLERPSGVDFVLIGGGGDS